LTIKDIKAYPLEVNEEFLLKHPAIEGPGYV
jgi:hypothetical protein